MHTSLYIAFVVAAALLIVSPGPTVMLVTSTSLRRGARAGLVAVAGSTLAAALQLGVVVGGLASVVSLAGHWFDWLRWIGVAYLVFLGCTAWRVAAPAPVREPLKVESTAVLRHFAEGFLVTLTNPKTLLFHGAFLPQFVDPDLPELPQLLVLAGSFVVIAGLGDSAWAVLAARARGLFASSSARRTLDRVSGSILILAGVLLASVRRGH